MYQNLLYADPPLCLVDGAPMERPTLQARKGGRDAPDLLINLGLVTGHLKTLTPYDLWTKYRKVY